MCFPKQRSAKIAVKEVQGYIGDIETLLFLCFDDDTARIYRELCRGDRDAMRQHAQEIDRDRGGLGRWFDGAAFGTAPAFEENATFFLKETPSLSLRLRSVPRFSGLANATRTRSNRVRVCSTRVRSLFDP